MMADESGRMGLSVPMPPSLMMAAAQGGLPPGWRHPFFTNGMPPPPPPQPSAPGYSRPPSLSDLLYERLHSGGIPGPGVVVGPGAGSVTGPIAISGPPWSTMPAQQGTRPESHLPTTLLFPPPGVMTPGGLLGVGNMSMVQGNMMHGGNAVHAGNTMAGPAASLANTHTGSLHWESLSSAGTVMGPVPPNRMSDPTGMSSYTSHHPYHMSAEERREARRQARLKARGTPKARGTSSVPSSPPSSPSRPSQKQNASSLLSATTALQDAKGGGAKPEDGAKPRPKKSAGASKELPGGLVKSCFNCRTTTTPMWRRGQSGEHSVVLCNACGVRFKKGRLMTVHDKDVFHAASVLSDLLTSTPRSPAPAKNLTAPTA